MHKNNIKIKKIIYHITWIVYDITMLQMWKYFEVLNRKSQNENFLSSQFNAIKWLLCRMKHVKIQFTLRYLNIFYEVHIMKWDIICNFYNVGIITAQNEKLQRMQGHPRVCFCAQGRFLYTPSPLPYRH